MDIPWLGRCESESVGRISSTDVSRRRRDRDAAIPRRRVAASAATWTVRGAERRRRRYDGASYKHAVEQCVVPDDECSKQGGAQVSELCRLGVYVSWSGTNKLGRALLSQMNRFSRLERSQVVSLVSDLSGNYVDL